MSTEESLKSGRPAEALQQLQDAVRKDPADPKLRVFLFQLLAILGQWDRANDQLTVAGELDAGNLAMVQAYRMALRCEALRAEVFAGRRAPLVFGEPTPWLALQLQALGLQASGHPDKAAKVREQAFADAPATPGRIDGAVFSWIADADMRLGPALEGIVNGNYYWIPFDRIRRIQLEAPSDLRDLVWTPAHFMWSNGGEAFGFVPTRYPSTEAQADGQLQLARRTEWQEAGAETYLGLGQRILTTDTGDQALLDLRLIELDSPAEAEKPGKGDA